MYSPLINTVTLAHAPGGMLLGIILVAAALGFVAGLFFQRAASQRRNQDRE
jgi:hypothetical protein